ncbi:HlyD family secretion protein [Chitinophaga polysaccharea]|uniref:HlyD family secretion protein n=1 Tax=Chitinophaga polysaccharea TaxID=1293035 RepID=UPI0011573C8D|nr:hypothetical protein [Chitinophaga polysaccharea]
MLQLFPSEAVENSVESYLPVVNTRSQIIYITIVCSVIAIIFSLPFIYVDVSASANGQIQARVEKQDVIIPVNGFLTKIDLRENMLVRKDSIIWTIDERSVDKQADIHTNRLSEYRNYLADISLLLAGDDSPKTPYYKASLLQYKEAISEAKTRVSKFKIDMERSQQLFQEKVIAASEFENIKLSYDQSVSSLNMVTQKQRNVWESEALNYKEQIRTIESSAVQLVEEKRRYTIKAPISGNIQQLQGVQLGSYVSGRSQ